MPAPHDTHGASRLQAVESASAAVDLTLQEILNVIPPMPRGNDGGAEGAEGGHTGASRLFRAQLAATVQHCGEEGLPIGLLPRKFSQVHDEPSVLSAL
jgi:hypothetical protein